MALAASDARVRDCMLLKMSPFVLARAVDRADACTLANVRDQLPQSDVSYAQFMSLYVTQPAFRAIRAE